MAPKLDCQTFVSTFSVAGVAVLISLVFFFIIITFRTGTAVQKIWDKRRPNCHQILSMSFSLYSAFKLSFPIWTNSRMYFTLLFFFSHLPVLLMMLFLSPLQIDCRGRSPLWIWAICQARRRILINGFTTTQITGAWAQLGNKHCFH